MSIPLLDEREHKTSTDELLSEWEDDMRGGVLSNEHKEDRVEERQSLPEESKLLPEDEALTSSKFFHKFVSDPQPRPHGKSKQPVISQRSVNSDSSRSSVCVLL